MHRVDPSLVRRALRIKHVLTFQQMQDHRAYGVYMLNRYRAEPGLLDRILYIDEGTIYLVGSMDNQKLLVWCDKHDKEVSC